MPPTTQFDAKLFERVTPVVLAMIHESPVNGGAEFDHRGLLRRLLAVLFVHVIEAAFVLADPRSPAVTKSAKVVLARVERVVFMGDVWLGGELGGLVLGKRVWEILESGLGEFFGVSALCLQR
jgi:hypothetical protein